MANTKQYRIEINGITESIDAAKSLLTQLNAIEAKIKEINALGGSLKSVKVSDVDDSATANALRTQREINKLKEEGLNLDAKTEAAQNEIYQRVDATKQVYKETVAQQKAIAAQERLTADAYSNTMVGMKQHLADLKAVIQTTDLGDGENIKKMTDEANKLNEELKKIEQSYGQFGRNVGNYPSSMEKLKVVVAGVAQEFDNAKQAAKTLGNELKTLQAKRDNGQILSEEELKRFRELPEVVAKLKSSMNDAGKRMDSLMDAMQSFVAMAQVSKGFAAFFGIDDEEIQKSIQQLLALQQAMSGIKTINEQLQSSEFMGGLFSKGSEAIDSFVAKITGAKKAQEGLNAATTASTVASKAMTTAEQAQTVATTQATVATKALSFALKTIGIGLVITAVATLITYWKDIVGWFKKTVPELQGLEKWFDKIRAVVVGVGTAIANWLIQPLATLVKVIVAIINGEFKEIPKIIASGLKKQFNVIGNAVDGYYKERERQQDAHNKKMREKQKKANEEQLKDEEAKYGKSHKRTQEYLKKQLALTEKGSKEYKELQRQLWEDERQEREENNKKNKKDTETSEKELAQARISQMKEGLNKTITQLEEERKQRLSKLNRNSKGYQEIVKIYQDKITQAVDNWNKEMIKSNQEMWTTIKQDTLKNSKDIYNGMLNSVEVGDMKIAEAANKLFNQDIASYGIQGKNQLSGDVRRKLGIISTDETTEIIKDYKDLIDIQRDFYIAENDFKTVQIKNTDELEAAENHLLQVRVETSEKLKKLEWEKAFMWDEEYEKARYNIVKTLDIEENRVSKLRETLNSEYEAVKTHYDYQKALLDNYNSELAKKYDTQEKIMQADEVKKMLLEEGYTKELRTIFNQRISAIDTYWAMRISNEKTYADVLYEQQKRILDREHELALSANVKHWDEMQEASSKAYDKEIDGILAQQDRKLISEETAKALLLEADKKYQKKANEIYANYKTQEAIIDKNYNTNLEKLELEKNKKLQDINKEYYESQLQELRDFQTAVNNLASKQPVRNEWGITNFKETNKNNRQLLSSYEAMFNQIAKMRNEINQKFQKGLINKDVYDSSIRELDNFSADLGNKMDEVKQKLSVGDQIGEFISDIQQYVQALGQGLQQIMSAVWSAQDQEFDNESRQLDKMNEALQKAMDKNEEILQKHQQNVNDIEGELQTARGDRREHLIDQLNAEIEAERRAAAEKKKLEKEQEALERKQEELDKKRTMAQYNRELAQILVSGALAAVNAYATKPFVPVGLAMGSLSLGLTAAQYAIAKANPPKFANGGLLEGKSHAQGGIKAGGVELEGNEYVINKHTTMQNIDLLEYINSNRRKLNISDLIDFYQGDRPRKSVQGVKTRFADGGQIPTLRTDIEVSDRLITAFQDYSNRNVVVSVVDINKKQKDVKNVRVLAGLDE